MIAALHRVRIAAIACGARFSLFVTALDDSSAASASGGATGGALFACGDGASGQLGIGRTCTAVDVPTLVRFNALAAVADAPATRARRRSDAADADADGKAGDDDIVETNDAVLADAASFSPRIVAIAAGALHAIARTESGHVLAWGGNMHGQLGTGDRLPRYVPVAVRHAAADGGPDAAGEHKHGEDEDNGTGAANADRQALPPLLVTTCIAAGAYHSAAVEATTGELYTWGAPGGGRLGHSWMQAPGNYVTHAVGNAGDDGFGADGWSALRDWSGAAGTPAVSAWPLKAFGVGPCTEQYAPRPSRHVSAPAAGALSAASDADEESKHDGIDDGGDAVSGEGGADAATEPGSDTDGEADIDVEGRDAAGGAGAASSAPTRVRVGGSGVGATTASGKEAAKPDASAVERGTWQMPLRRSTAHAALRRKQREYAVTAAVTAQGTAIAPALLHALKGGQGVGAGGSSQFALGESVLPLAAASATRAASPINPRAATATLGSSGRLGFSSTAKSAAAVDPPLTELRTAVSQAVAKTGLVPPPLASSQVLPPHATLADSRRWAQPLPAGAPGTLPPSEPSGTVSTRDLHTISAAAGVRLRDALAVAPLGAPWRRGPCPVRLVDSPEGCASPQRVVHPLLSGRLITAVACGPESTTVFMRECSWEACMPCIARHSLFPMGVTAPSRMPWFAYFAMLCSHCAG